MADRAAPPSSTEPATPEQLVLGVSAVTQRAAHGLLADMTHCLKVMALCCNPAEHPRPPG